MLALTAGQRKIIGWVDRLGRLLGMGKAAPLPDPSAVKTILVLELWGIGDVVLATTVLQGLKAHYPQARISLLAQGYAQPILKGCPWVDEIIPFKFPWTAQTNKYDFWRYPWKKLFHLVKRLRNPRFDLAVDARIDIRNNFLLWLSGARYRVAYGDDGGGFLLNVPLQKPETANHRVEKWRYLLEAAGFRGTPPEPALKLEVQDLEAAEQWLAEKKLVKDTLWIGIHPGAANSLRRWPVERFLQVVRGVEKHHAVHWLVFGEDGLRESEDLARQIGKAATRVTGDLRRFMALAKRCDLLLMNDSGPMHLAAALGIPLVAIFGPTRPDWFGPWGKNVKLVMRDDVDCRGCYERCIHDRPHCMAIAPEDTIAAVLKMLEQLEKK